MLAGAVACVTLATAQTAGAQSLTIGGGNSNFGSVTLAPGFTPDPHEVRTTSGGGLNVRDMNLGSGCVGYATSRPDFILHLSASADFLRFYNEGEGDTGLAINDPAGTWHCDDDSHTGTNPLVTLNNAREGQYDIWVTSYSSGENLSGTLFITELRSNPSTSGSSSNGSLSMGGSNANFGTATLDPGFTPDPHEVSITSGGSLNVRDMDLGAGCVGYATRQPDFILHLSSSTSFLRFYNEGDGDTGLVINDPTGTWRCDDDSHTDTNPMVSINNASSGQYDIWVTSYSSDDNIRGTLHITELRSNPGGGSGGSLLARGSNANYGSATLSPGFTPDPHTVSITSGGSLSVNSMNLGSGCVGYATEPPDFILHLTATSNLLRFYVTGDGDTGLVIHDPNGGWHCNDDSYGGTDPTVSLNGTGKGQFDVWVTSYSRDDRIQGTLYITELESRHPGEH
jgi:hypothetical protein